MVKGGTVMIINISDREFRRILDNPKFNLPIRWSGDDFRLTVDGLFNQYINNLEKHFLHDADDPVQYEDYIVLIKSFCGYIKRAIEYYLNGFPSKAYQEIEQLMNNLVEYPLEIYPDKLADQFSQSSYDDKLSLFRIVEADSNIPYPRKRLFHPPFNMRSQVSTTRYSIAGYPSLYLGTSLDLCCEEIHLNPYRKFPLAALFQLENCAEYSNTEVNLIDLAIKPQDFFEEIQNDIESSLQKRRVIPLGLLNHSKVRSRYLLWYPLIAACSFIRTNKYNAFAAEYIVPQLLMQWLRIESDNRQNKRKDLLMGIRYFSCASLRASDMGFTYVFPTSGEPDSYDYPYCRILMNAFKLTKPVFMHEFSNRQQCEEYLKNQTDINYINTD